MQFRGDCAETFIQIFEENAHAIRSTEGCQYLELLRGADTPATFFTISIWESQHALDAYRDSPLFKETWSRTKQLFEAKPMAWSLKTVNTLA